MHRSSIYLPLPTREREALCELADREFRDPKDQARLLLVEGLRRAGALPADETESHRADGLPAVKGYSSFDEMVADLPEARRP